MKKLLVSILILICFSLSHNAQTLYGLTQQGAGTAPFFYSNGALFSYSLSTSTYKVENNFCGGCTGRPSVAQGIRPSGSLLQASDGKLYGMTEIGGLRSYGVIFSYLRTTSENQSPQNYAVLHDFDLTNTGGAPTGSLVEASNGLLFGMTSRGGSHDNGVLFSYSFATSAFTKLYDFDNTNGANPRGSLLKASDGNLYGMTSAGGSNGGGVIFSYSPANGSFTKRYDFTSADGNMPFGSFVEGSNGNLYAMTSSGGSNNGGVIFSFSTLTSTFSKLYDLNSPGGILPFGDLSRDADGELYGMTRDGGINGKGVIFRFSPVSSEYTKLFDFDQTNGANPRGSLTKVSDGKFYGMTTAGGGESGGVLFSYSPTTSAYAKLLDFSATRGNTPYGSLIEATDIFFPAIPKNLYAVYTGSTYVNLDWDNSVGDPVAVSYDVYKNGIFQFTTINSDTTVSGLVPGTTYSFSVKARDASGNTSAFSEPLNVTTKSAGLNLQYKFYEGVWSVLPDFTKLTPLQTGYAVNVDINVRPAGVNDHFGFVWEGHINMPSPGAYTFEIISDDGSKLYFNTFYDHHAEALVDNDGLHYNRSATGTVNITEAGLYPIALSFFEKEAGEMMELYWSGPGFERQRVPDSAFADNHPVPPAANGLDYKYYEGTWDALPDFTSLTPVKTGITTNVDLGMRTPGRNENFAFLWEGYIDIPEAGEYIFETVSDDGSKLYFDSFYSPGATALVINDGLHAERSATGTVYISTAGLHRISITFFEKDGDEKMQVYWSRPGHIQRQIIPGSAFRRIAPNPVSGLHYRHYQGTWNELPDFNMLHPVKRGSTPNVSLSERLTNDHYAFVWEGYITLPAAGEYTFETVSDDGSKLYFNSFYAPSATPLVNNDGLHAERSATGSVNASAGSYPIAITFFEKDGGELMEVYWTRPGFGRERIPHSAFTQGPGATDSQANTFVTTSVNKKSAVKAVTDNTVIRKIYPNPFIETFSIDFNNSAGTNEINVGLYDMKGRLVHLYHAGKMSSGNTTVRVNLSKERLLPGVYMAALHINGVPSKVVQLIKADR